MRTNFTLLSGLILLLALCPFKGKAQQKTCLKTAPYSIDAKSILTNIYPGQAAVFVDFNGDGRTDLVQETGGGGGYITIYLQSPAGHFIPTDSVPFTATNNYIRVLDLDRNGTLDVVSLTDYGVITARTNGSGHFIGTDTIQTLNPVSSFIAGDYDNDGIVDVLLSSNNNTALIYKGNGSNQYLLHDTIFNCTFSEGFVLDLNNDGNNDIIALSPAYKSIFIYSRDATDSVGMMATIPDTGNVHLAVQDMNRDGLTDLLISGNGLTILRNNNNFNFTLQYQTLLLTPENFPYQTEVFTGDLDRDGYPDICLRALHAALVIHNPNGILDTTHLNLFSINDDVCGEADVNNDGFPDMMCEAGSGLYTGMFAMMNDGKGVFQGENLLYGVGVSGVWPVQLQIRDIYHTGKNNLLAWEPDGVFIYDYIGNRTWSGIGGLTFPLSLQAGKMTDYVLDHINNDSIYDFLLPPDQSGNMAAVYGFRPIPPPGIGYGYDSMVTITSIPYSMLMAPADMNHDGKRDIVASAYPGSTNPAYIAIALNDGQGHFLPPVYPFPTGFNNNYNPATHLSVNDFNHDTYPDIFFDCTLGLAYMVGQSGLNFTTPATLPGTTGVSDFVLQDFNHDTYTDLAILRDLDTVMVFLGNATGFTFQTKFVASGGSIAAGDYDQDGKIDLIVSSRSNKNLLVFNGQGNGLFTAGYTIPCPIAGSSMVIGYLDEDKYMDIAAMVPDTLMCYYADTLQLRLFSDNTLCAPKNISVETDSSSSLDWFRSSQNLSQHNVNPVSVTQSGWYHASATTSYGCVLQSDSIHVHISACDSVWPGDANMDGICSNLDLLYLGMNYGSSGTSRTLQGNAWSPHEAANWGMRRDSLDLKFSDCDGNGVINASDTLAIVQNFNSPPHSLAQPFSASNDKFQFSGLYLTTPQSSYAPGQLIDVSLWCGSSSNPETSVYGLAWELGFDASHIQPGSAWMSYPSSWMGVPGSTALTLAKVMEPAHVAHGAIVRTTHTNASGFGKIGDLHFKASSSISVPTYLDMQIEGLQVIDSAGKIKSMEVHPLSILIDPSLIAGISPTGGSGKVSMSAFPNPFSEFTRIRFTLNNRCEMKAEVFDVSGRKVATLISGIQSAGDYELTYDATGREAGIYFVKITMGDQACWEKIVQVK